MGRKLKERDPSLTLEGLCSKRNFIHGWENLAKYDTLYKFVVTGCNDKAHAEWVEDIAQSTTAPWTCVKRGEFLFTKREDAELYYVYKKISR